MLQEDGIISLNFKGYVSLNRRGVVVRCFKERRGSKGPKPTLAGACDHSVHYTTPTLAASQPKQKVTTRGGKISHRPTCFSIKIIPF